MKDWLILTLGAVATGSGAILGVLLGWPGDIVPQYVLLIFTCIAAGSAAIAASIGVNAARNAISLGAGLQREQVRSSVLEASSSPQVVERANAAAEAVAIVPSAPPAPGG